MILVVIEQREGKLNRVSYGNHHRRAGYCRGNELAGRKPLCLGNGVSSIAAEIATKKVQTRCTRSRATNSNRTRRMATSPH